MISCWLINVLQKTSWTKGKNLLRMFSASRKCPTPFTPQCRSYLLRLLYISSVCLYANMSENITDPMTLIRWVATNSSMKEPKKKVYCLPWARCTTSLKPCSIPTFSQETYNMTFTGDANCSLLSKPIGLRWFQYHANMFCSVCMSDVHKMDIPGDLPLAIDALVLKPPSMQPCTSP